VTSTELTAIETYLKQKRQFVDCLLDRYLPSEETEPTSLHAAMRYSVMAGGKRLRPILALTAYEYCGGNDGEQDRPIDLAAAALEMVHTYSLIHDDLPCMDDDDLRRGMPTCHKKFGEAVAVLTGDALHDLAFSLVAGTGTTQVVAELAHAIGTEGMIGGQIADVEAEGRDVTRDDIIYIHTRKTAALIRCSVRSGALLAGADPELLAVLTRYGEKVGLAFQIIDDILDIEGDRQLLGKNTGSDRKKQKATYPGAVGMERARRDAARLIEEAVNLFDAADDNVLKHLALYIGQRQY
jgi:geranylgeranyl diphosphate synthase type II